MEVFCRGIARIRHSATGDIYEIESDELVAGNRRSAGGARRPPDLSPAVHPAMGRVPVTFEPTRLGGATGWGAEPPV